MSVRDRIPKINEVIIPEIKIEEINYLSNPIEVDNYLNQWREGTFKKGLTTGIPRLDEFLLFKRGNFNIANGFDNVGKSTTLWYLCLLSAMFHNWKWILCSNENRNGTVVKRLIEFYCGQRIDKIPEKQFIEAKEFVNAHFTIISNDHLLSVKELLKIADKVNLDSKHDGMLIDPYNSLKIDLQSTSKLSTHEYHYEMASEMLTYTKKNDFCIYLNCHVITGALREGTAPKKADTEGGGKFSNKADDFITIHREVQNPENYLKTQIHVRKIKEVETGGGYTPYDQPFILEMCNGGCGFKDSFGFNPIEKYHYKNPPEQSKIDLSLTTEFKMQPNTNFYETESKEDAPF